MNGYLFGTAVPTRRMMYSTPLTARRPVTIFYNAFFAFRRVAP